MTDNAIEALKKEDLTPTGQEAVTELEDFLEEALLYLQFKHYYDDIAAKADVIATADVTEERTQVAAAHIKNVKEVMDRPPSADHHGRVKDPVTRKDLRNQLKREKQRYDDLVAQVSDCLAGHQSLEELAHNHPDLPSEVTPPAPGQAPESSGLKPADTSDLSTEHMDGHTH